MLGYLLVRLNARGRKPLCVEPKDCDVGQIKAPLEFFPLRSILASFNNYSTRVLPSLVI
jgi:hypothetical protein